MESKQAFIVTGPEGCGNRLIASAFAEAGCHGEGSTKARFNWEVPEEESPVIIIRSFPHGEVWPDLTELDQELKEKGYHTVYIITVRDFSCYRGSWIKDRPEQAEEWLQNYQDAYRDIFKSMGEIGASFLISPYEALMANTSTYLTRLVTQCGLPHQFCTFMIDGVRKPIRDGNGKYYD